MMTAAPTPTERTVGHSTPVTGIGLGVRVGPGVDVASDVSVGVSVGVALPPGVGVGEGEPPPGVGDGDAVELPPTVRTAPDLLMITFCPSWLAEADVEGSKAIL